MAFPINDNTGKLIMATSEYEQYKTPHLTQLRNLAKGMLEQPGHDCPEYIHNDWKQQLSDIDAELANRKYR